MPAASASIEQRIATLEAHLEQENPLLLDAVKSFRELDKVAYRLGILTPEESFTTQVPWWPMIAVLGTFSSGKSSFINHFSAGPAAVDRESGRRRQVHGGLLRNRRDAAHPARSGP